MIVSKIGPVLATTLLLSAVSNVTAADLNTDAQKLGYIIGLEFGRNLKEQGNVVDLDALMDGLKTNYSGAELQMTTEEVQAFITEYKAKQESEREKQVSEAAASNKAQGEAFLETNRARDGVIETESGLQYEVMSLATHPLLPSPGLFHCAASDRTPGSRPAHRSWAAGSLYESQGRQCP